MNKRFKTKAKYENGLIKPNSPINLPEGSDIEIIILEELRDDENDVTTKDLMNLADTNPSLDFLKDSKEDIYTVDDLKVRYK